MAEGTPNSENAEGKGQGGKTFTQDEVNRLVGERVARERGKYADYEDLKAKAEKYDEAQEAAKSELDKAREAAEKATAELEAMKADAAHRGLVDKVSSETGIPGNLLHGDSEDELRASAEALSAFVESRKPTPPLDKGGAPAPPGAVTRDSIEKIKDPVARVKARAAHAELYRR